MTGADFLTVDADGDQLFDALNATLHLDLAAAGSYQLNASLVWPGAGTVVATSASGANLRAGASLFTLRFEGTAISEKQLDGPYEMQVELRSNPAGAVSESASFATPTLRASDFEAAAAGARPRLEVAGTEVRLEGAGVEATVDLARPRLAWSGRDLPRVELAFPRAVAFADDGDGAFEDGEEVCSADLGGGAFALRALDVGPSPDLGWVIAVGVGGRVEFEGPSCATPVPGNASFTFTIAERNGTMPGPVALPTLGGFEVGVVGTLEVDGALPASAIAVEAELSLQGKGIASFLVPGPDGFASVDASGPDAALSPVAAGRPSDRERVSLVNATGAVLGYLGWSPLSPQALSTGLGRFGAVEASQGLSNGTLRLALAAPSGPQLRGGSFGAIVGAVPLEHPPPLGTPPPPPPPTPPSALVFAAALAAASAMFFFSVYARAKKY
jgi:hypothetical protein